MRFKNYPFIITTLLFVLIFSAYAFAGNGDKVGTTAAPELLIPIGARDMAMGGSSIAYTSGIESMYWNPAGLSHSDRKAVAMFSHLTYLADIDLNYVGVAGAFGNFGTVGFDIKAMSFGDIPVTTTDFPDGTGGIVSPTFFTMGIHYSKQLSDRVSIGVTGNFINEDLSEARVQATGFAFSAGVQYRGLGGLDGLDLGVVVKNVGPSMSFSGSGLLRTGQINDTNAGNVFTEIKGQSSELPSIIGLGLSYAIRAGENNSLRVNGTFQNNNFSDDQFKLGAEYTFNNLVYVRGGYDVSPSAATEAFIYGASLGAGVHLELGGVDLTVDYAWIDTDFFDSQNAFSIKLGF